MILGGIVVEKYKGDAEVASCGHGDDDNSDATTASNDAAATVSERSELVVLCDDLQPYAVIASFLEKFEVILAGVLIVQRKPIVLQPLFRELMNQLYTRAETMSAPGTNNASKQVAMAGSPLFEAFSHEIVSLPRDPAGVNRECLLTLHGFGTVSRGETSLSISPRRDTHGVRCVVNSDNSN